MSFICPWICSTMEFSFFTMMSLFAYPLSLASPSVAAGEEVSVTSFWRTVLSKSIGTVTHLNSQGTISFKPPRNNVCTSIPSCWPLRQSILMVLGGKTAKLASLFQYFWRAGCVETHFQGLKRQQTKQGGGRLLHVQCFTLSTFIMFHSPGKAYASPLPHL